MYPIHMTTPLPAPPPPLQCDRGTALHEAAMCGKMETVELLLDKGVNYDLRDSEGRTVQELLDQFPADRANEIGKKIQSEGEGGEREGGGREGGREGGGREGKRIRVVYNHVFKGHNYNQYLKLLLSRLLASRK